MSVAVIQGAIPQDEKWLESNRDTTLNLYQSLTEQVLGTRLIVWPESAPADLANQLVPYITNLYRETRAQWGRPSSWACARRGRQRLRHGYYNSVLALDAAPAWYDKSHLVPFAEYFPVPGFVRTWLRLLSLPYSDFTPGTRSATPAGGGTEARHDDML